MAKEIKLKIPALKKKLNECKQQELVNMIGDLYKLNPEVKDYLHVKFVGEEAVQELFERALKEIEDEFFPDKGFGKMRLAKAKKAISNFKKQTNDTEKVLDLMLYYVENGTAFTLTYGDIDERFYNSMETMYEKIIEMCEKDKGLFTHFKDRLYAIVIETEGMGWGYHDHLYYVYHSIHWLGKS